LKSNLVNYITGSPIAGDNECYPHRPTSQQPSFSWQQKVCKPHPLGSWW